MFEWAGIMMAGLVSGGALWLIERAARRNDKRLDEMVTDEVCQLRVMASGQRFDATDSRLDRLDERLNRLDDRIERVRGISEETLSEVQKINGGNER